MRSCMSVASTRAGCESGAAVASVSVPSCGLVAESGAAVCAVCRLHAPFGAGLPRSQGAAVARLLPMPAYRALRSGPATVAGSRCRACVADASLGVCGRPRAAEVGAQSVQGKVVPNLMCLIFGLWILGWVAG